MFAELDGAWRIRIREIADDDNRGGENRRAVDLDHRVVAVRMLAHAVVVHQAMAVAELDPLGDGVHRTVMLVPRGCAVDSNCTNQAGRAGEFVGHRLARDLGFLPLAIDHAACILCDRCVRACSEVAGNFVIGRMMAALSRHWCVML